MVGDMIVTVVIKRKTKMIGEAGGDVSTYTQAGTAIGRKRNYSSAKWMVDPEREKVQLFWLFDKPLPDIRRHDRIIEPDGTIWNVLNVRPYTMNLQVDCDLVE